MNATCNLADRHCVPCEGGVAPLSRTEAEALLAQVPGWTLDAAGKCISKRFEFRGFFRTMGFVNAMAWVATQQDHHPDFAAGYNWCEVTFTTHAIDGLSDNDFICAARVNALLEAG